jgi:hypothetical protein
VTIEAGSKKTVKLNPSTTPALRLANPKLWWPAGYGDPSLYPVDGPNPDDNRKGTGTYVVTGHGPYRVPPKMHSEMGMPNVPTIESVELMLPESALWPQNLIWGLHDYRLAPLLAGTPWGWPVQRSAAEAGPQAL